MSPLSPDALKACAAAFGFQPEELTFISASQNHVYRVERKNASPVILRISLDRCHAESEIEAELRWLNWLHGEAHCDFVCVPLPSPGGKLLEIVHMEDSSAFVSVFQHAPGRPIAETDLNDGLYFTLGRRLGKLHAHTKNYPEPPDCRRRPWHESRLLNEDLERYVPAGLTGFRKAVRGLIAELKALPSRPDSYGMIHADYYFQNLFIDDGRLWLFDFDNCEHGYFLQDLATCLYDCTFNRLTREQRTADPACAFSRQFWDELVCGYREQHSLPINWAESLRAFVVLREAVIYIHYHRMYTGSDKPESFWTAIDEMRRNVEEGRSSLGWVNQL